MSRSKTPVPGSVSPGVLAAGAKFSANIGIDGVDVTHSRQVLIYGTVLHSP